MAGKAKKKISNKNSKKSRKELFSSPSSYKSLFYGIATVIILFILGFTLTKLILRTPQPEIDGGAVSTSKIEEALMEVQKNKYTVKDGDTLWSIAEEKYGTGFEWYKIANANKITDVTALEPGVKLAVPQEENSTIVPTRNVTSTTPDTTSTSQKITGKTYVIMHGDDLWDIAVRAYGDGYRWVDIAKANNLLADPNLIHGDNTLRIPR